MVGRTPWTDQRLARPAPASRARYRMELAKRKAAPPAGASLTPGGGLPQQALLRDWDGSARSGATPGQAGGEQLS